MADWYKMNPIDWNQGTDGLTLEQEAAYLRICNAIYISGGSIRNNPHVLTGLFRCQIRKARRLVSDLIDAGKLSLEGDSLVNRRCDVELTLMQRLSDVRATSGRRRGNAKENSPAKVLKLNGSGQANAFTQDSQIREEKKRKDKKPSIEGKKQTPKRKSRLEPEWFPTKNGFGYAEGEGLDQMTIYDEVEKFKDHHISKGNLMVDWSAAWRTWVRNSIEFKARRQERENKWR